VSSNPVGRLVRVEFGCTVHVTYSGSVKNNAGYVYVRSGRELNAVERIIIGVKHALDKRFVRPLK
jgi:hypothetical protein